MAFEDSKLPKQKTDVIGKSRPKGSNIFSISIPYTWMAKVQKVYSSKMDPPGSWGTNQEEISKQVAIAASNHLGKPVELISDDGNSIAFSSSVKPNKEIDRIIQMDPELFIKNELPRWGVTYSTPTPLQKEVKKKVVREKQIKEVAENGAPTFDPSKWPSKNGQCQLCDKRRKIYTTNMEEACSDCIQLEYNVTAKNGFHNQDIDGLVDE